MNPAPFPQDRAVFIGGNRVMLPALASVLLLLSPAAPPVVQDGVRAATNQVVVQVVDASGLPLPGMTVTVESCVDPAIVLVTDARGLSTFTPPSVPTACRATVSGLSGVQPTVRDVRIDGSGSPVRLTVDLAFAEQVTVTETGATQLIRETPAAVASLPREQITAIAPTHPGQLLGQVAGVWVNTTGGEGHQTAIRQPLTTNPVYLYLEDGVPTRSTGFFNHNALYEVNVAAAAGVEVTKGPGSVLYGSDAIGGVVNVITRSALDAPAWEVELEGGQHGWARLLTGGSVRRGRQGVRADVNLTQTDGWREATGYDRQSGSIRWDRTGDGTVARALVTFSRVDQQTAGSSALAEVDYLSNPRLNLTPISRRDVRAFRASFDFTRVSGTTVWNVIPYFRDNRMDLLANWSLTYDPTDARSGNRSVGLLARLQRELPAVRGSLSAGVDIDYSPGGRLERVIVPTTEPTPNGRPKFVAYTDGPVVYDYDVVYAGVAPYAQIDWTLGPRLRAQTGVRFDASRYDYRDLLDTPETPRHRRPDDAVRNFRRLTPKLGLTWAASDTVSLFASYRDAFRAPSEGQLFRQGTAINTIDLAPVKATNAEAGIRLSRGLRWNADVSVYRLVKRDDILSFRDPDTGATEARNAGRTRHTGIELSGALALHRSIRVSTGWSYARHEYVDWQVDPAAGLDYSGLTMELAPATIGNVIVTLTPIRWLHGSIELSRIGPYFMDAANTERYDGHTLLNLRLRVPLHESLQLHVRVLNLTDARYAESASYTTSRGREFAPGAPRTVYASIGWQWQ
jgi:iron complex outermembrane receptor protein